MEEGFMRMLILAGMVMIYPVLANNGIKMHGPLALCADREDAFSDLLRILGWGKEVETLLISEPPKKLEKAISESRQGRVILSYANGRYTAENLEMICNQMLRKGGDVSLEKICVVLFYGMPVKAEIFAGVTYVKEISEDRDGQIEKIQKFLKELIQFLIKNENLVVTEINEKLMEKRIGGETEVLWAAIFALEASALRSMTESAVIPFRKSLFELGEKMEEDWFSVGDPEIYAKAFCRCLYHCQKKLPKMLCRERVMGSEVQYLKEAAFFDDDFYYFPVNVIEEICQKIAPGESQLYVKSQLAEAALLVCEGQLTKHYTKMTGIITVYGKVFRIRRVKIRRKKMENSQELTLLELFQAR